MRLGGSLFIPVVVAAALLLAACAPTGRATPMPSPRVTTVAESAQPGLGVRDTVYDPAGPAPALRLTDQDGHVFDLASLRGEPALIYFGYTHCPDICPATLADIRDALRQVHRPVAVVFVTIDPERDTPAAMRQYVDAFGAGFVGLTGSPAEIAVAAGAWGVSYRRLPEPSGGAGYAMAHTTDTYLVDAKGVLRNHLFFGAGPAIIAAAIRAALA